MGLAADRAGKKFAEASTREPKSALRLQIFAATMTDNDLLIANIKLAERISRSTFEANDKTIESDVYKKRLTQ